MAGPQETQWSSYLETGRFWFSHGGQIADLYGVWHAYLCSARNPGRDWVRAQSRHVGSGCHHLHHALWFPAIPQR